MKDCIIGGIDGYTWDDIKPWVNSAKQSGFEGDIMVVATNISKKEARRISDNGVIVQIYGNVGQGSDFEEYYSASQDFAPHVARFFYMWNVLNNGSYGYVLATDTRDVIFQRNPMEYLKHYSERLVVSSEGMKYRNEPWGAQNYQQCFGPVLYKQVENKLIHNVGVIGGRADIVKDTLLTIFTNSVNRPIKVVDQAVFNFLLNQAYVDKNIAFTENNDGWAIQLGTTEGAIKSGRGDIGMRAMQNPKALEEYYETYEDVQPYIDEKGVVYPSEENEPFYVVHQYDRINGLKEKIEARYV